MHAGHRLPSDAVLTIEPVGLGSGRIVASVVIGHPRRLDAFVRGLLPHERVVRRPGFSAIVEVRGPGAAGELLDVLTRSEEEPSR